MFSDFKKGFIMTLGGIVAYSTVYAIMHMLDSKSTPKQGETEKSDYQQEI